MNGSYYSSSSYYLPEIPQTKSKSSLWLVLVVVGLLLTIVFGLIWIKLINRGSSSPPNIPSSKLITFKVLSILNSGNNDPCSRCSKSMGSQLLSGAVRYPIGGEYFGGWCGESCNGWCSSNDCTTSDVKITVTQGQSLEYTWYTDTDTKPVKLISTYYTITENDMKDETSTLYLCDDTINPSKNILNNFSMRIRGDFIDWPKATISFTPQLKTGGNYPNTQPTIYTLPSSNLDNLNIKVDSVTGVYAWVGQVWSVALLPYNSGNSLSLGIVEIKSVSLPILVATALGSSMSSS